MYERAITIDGKKYFAGTAKVEDDFNCLPSAYVVTMQSTTCMLVTFKRFKSANEAKAYADELNAM